MKELRILELLANAISREYEEIEMYPSNASLADLGFDSLCFINFIVSVEEEFSIEVPDNDLLLSNFETKEMILASLEALVNSPSDVDVKKS